MEATKYQWTETACDVTLCPRRYNTTRALHTNFYCLLSNMMKITYCPFKQRKPNLFIFLYAALVCLDMAAWMSCSIPSALTFPPLRPGSAEEKAAFNRCRFSSTVHSMSTARSSSPAAWSGAPCTSRRSFGARTPSALTRRITSSSSKAKRFLLPAPFCLRHSFFACLSSPAI